MLSLETLAALDLHVWLRSGGEAARRLAITQPTASRRVRQALRCFRLRLRNPEGEWDLVGSSSHLEMSQMERHVHQSAEDSGFAVLQLCRMPVQAVVAADHPLLLQYRQRGTLSWEDVAAFPSLALPAGAYPRVEASLRALGLWSTSSRMGRYRRELWEGRSERELMVAYATVLSERIAGDQVRLPLALPIESGEALVVLCRWIEQPQLQVLARLLRQRLKRLARHYPELEITP